MSDQTFSRFRPHPWHGLPVGPEPPVLVNAFIEITPFDPVKYEIDKASGYLKVDRPQRFTSTPPSLYGFIPRTYCGARISALTPGTSYGDRDPLDICVLAERPIQRSEVLLEARVVGGMTSVDRQEADDKIVAVLRNDDMWGQVTDLEQLPPVLVERLRHYFGTYKMAPGQASAVAVLDVYGSERAHATVLAAMADYEERFGG